MHRSRRGGPEAVLDAVAALSPSDQTGLVRGLVGLIRELQDRGDVPTTRMCVNCAYFRPHAHPGASKAHHCAYIDAPIGDRDLRIDCREMAPAPAEDQPRLWRLYVRGEALPATHDP